MIQLFQKIKFDHFSFLVGSGLVESQSFIHLQCPVYGTPISKTTIHIEAKFSFGRPISKSSRNGSFENLPEKLKGLLRSLYPLECSSQSYWKWSPFSPIHLSRKVQVFSQDIRTVKHIPYDMNHIIWSISVVPSNRDWMHIKIAFIVSTISLAKVRWAAELLDHQLTHIVKYSKSNLVIFLINSNISVLGIKSILRHCSSPAFLNSNNLSLMVFSESNLSANMVRKSLKKDIVFERALFDIQAKDYYFTDYYFTFVDFYSLKKKWL